MGQRGRPAAFEHISRRQVGMRIVATVVPMILFVPMVVPMLLFVFLVMYVLLFVSSDRLVRRPGGFFCFSMVMPGVNFPGAFRSGRSRTRILVKAGRFDFYRSDAATRCIRKTEHRPRVSQLKAHVPDRRQFGRRHRAMFEAQQIGQRRIEAQVQRMTFERSLQRRHAMDMRPGTGSAGICKCGQAECRANCRGNNFVNHINLKPEHCMEAVNLLTGDLHFNGQPYPLQEPAGIVTEQGRGSGGEKWLPRIRNRADPGTSMRNLT